jgi:Omp85 superfamily domain
MNIVNASTASIVLGLCLTAALRPALAQETRAAQIAAEQAEKATRLHPYVPSRAERILVRVDTALTGTPNGLYPNFGSVYTGGGLALGAGYRRFYGDRTFWDVKGLFSIKQYKLLELSTESPGHARGRLDLFGSTGWRDATDVAFYGVGNDSPNEGRTNFGLKQGYLTGGLRARPMPAAILGGAVSYEDFRIEDPLGAKVSVAQVHTAQTAPGLGLNPSYLHSTASAGIDWRPSAGYARRGGLYEVEYHDYSGRGNADSFNRVDVNLIQHIPILRENWVLSLRGQTQTTLGDTDTVPFFLLPSLGSGSTLRGYSSWRFRDRQSLLVSAEWRWIPNRLGLDMALFYDAGKVAAHRSDLNFEDLKSDVGIGARFHGPAGTPLRIELAHGRDGLRLVIAGGPAF